MLLLGPALSWLFWLMDANLYTLAWFGWFAYFAVVEALALFWSWRRRRREPDLVGGTLSEHVWAWFGTAKGHKTSPGAWFRRFVLLCFVVWLAVHFLFGGRIV